MNDSNLIRTQTEIIANMQRIAEQMITQNLLIGQIFEAVKIIQENTIMIAPPGKN